MAAVGYQYVNLDDAWMDMHRLPNTSITWDPLKFPSGMPAVAAKLHAKGLSFGLYSARCRRTCEDYPASFGAIKHNKITLRSILSLNDPVSCVPRACLGKSQVGFGMNT
jgi:hypothetical protein